VAGICRTDVRTYAKPPFAAPVIMEHENVGVISRARRGPTRPGQEASASAGTSGARIRLDQGEHAIRALAVETGEDAIHTSMLAWEEKA
jgi:threonine dehydrogenase-like Zn-dependent dehydrogenase